MTRKSFLTLLALTVAVTAAAILIGPSTSPQPASNGALVAPALAKNINDVQTIAITGVGSSKVTIENSKTGWTVKESGGYPAQPDMVKKLLVSLAQLKVAEAKTNRPDLHERLGVEDVSKTGASSQLVTVTGAKGKTLASLIIGKSRSPRTGNAPGQVYYRKPGDKQAWQATGTVEVEDDHKDWLVKAVADIKRTRVRAVTITHKDGKTVTIERAKPGEKAKLTTTPLPEKMVPKKDGTIDAVATALEDIELDDAMRAKNVDFDKKTIATATFRTFDGLVIKAEMASAGKDEEWIRYTVSVDGKGAIGPPPEKKKSTEKKKDGDKKAGGDAQKENNAQKEGEAAKKAGLKTLADVKKEAEALKKRLDGWAFKLSKTTARHYRTKLKALIQKEKTS